MPGPARRDAVIFHEALHTNIDLKAVTDVICCRTPSQFEGLVFDQRLVEHDAKALYKAGEKRLGTDETTFINIFGERSRAHMAAVSSAYRNTNKNTLRKVILAFFLYS
ncbi:putative Annexin superfamily [Helianthus debilis subsp. tardiflorus]